jgi:hypothetical protein
MLDKGTWTIRGLNVTGGPCLLKSSGSTDISVPGRQCGRSSYLAYRIELLPGRALCGRCHREPSMSAYREQELGLWLRDGPRHRQRRLDSAPGLHVSHTQVIQRLPRTAAVDGMMGLMTMGAMLVTGILKPRLMAGFMAKPLSILLENIVKTAAAPMYSHLIELTALPGQGRNPTPPVLPRHSARSPSAGLPVADDQPLRSKGAPG